MASRVPVAIYSSARLASSSSGGPTPIGPIVPSSGPTGPIGPYGPIPSSGGILPGPVVPPHTRLSTEGMPKWGNTYINDQDRVNAYAEDRMIEGNLMTKDFYTIHGCLLDDTINSVDIADPKTHLGNIMCPLIPPNTLGWERQSQKDAAYLRQMTFPWTVSKAFADDPTMGGLLGYVYDDAARSMKGPGTLYGRSTPMAAMDAARLITGSVDTRPEHRPEFHYARDTSKAFGYDGPKPVRMSSRPYREPEQPSIAAMRRDYEAAYGIASPRVPHVSAKVASEVLSPLALRSAPIRLGSGSKLSRTQSLLADAFAPVRNPYI
jgi:hypothetical protein